MTEHEARSPGRPRALDTDRLVLEAVLDLVNEVGVAGVTVTAVAARAGVARATVYLRWPSRAALVGAATKAVTGGAPFVLSGDIERDIRVGADFVQGVISAPYFASILPELIRAVLATPSEVSFDALAPNRERLAVEYRDVGRSQGYDTALEPHLLFDLLFGACLSHLFATGTAPSNDYVRQLAEVVSSGLRDQKRPNRKRPG